MRGGPAFQFKPYVPPFPGGAMATKRDLLIGQLAVQRGYVTGEQLADALQKQADLSEVGMEQPLLQILFTKEYVDQAQMQELKADAETQPRRASPPKPPQQAEGAPPPEPAGKPGGAPRVKPAWGGAGKAPSCMA